MTTAQPSTRMDTYAALRNANFRLYFVGQLISLSGTWMQNIAQGYLVFQITHSEAWLGIVACVAGLPLVLLAPIAGVVVERIPRRRLLLMTQVSQMLLAFILAYLTATNRVEVWQIVVLAFLLGLTNALDMPGRYTFLVEIVGPEDLRSGIAVNAIMNSGSRVLGPALAGLALVQFGVAWCFLINGLSFVAVIFFLLIMKVPYPMAKVAHTDAVQQLKEGLRFVRSHERILPLLLLAAIGGFFIIPVIQVLPSFADVVLHSPTEGYAALTSAEGIGSIVSGLSVGWLAHRFGYGRIAAVTALMAGVSTFLVSQQTAVPVAAVVVAFSGLFTTLLVISTNTLIQIAVPDSFRGRVLALFTLCFPGLSPFGALVLGIISNVIGVSTGIALWGILGAAFGVAILLRWPHVSHARE